MPAPRDYVVTLERLVAKYSDSVPRVNRANSVSSLVDLLCQQAIYESPRLSYRDAMHQVLAADDELKRAYGES